MGESLSPVSSFILLALLLWTIPWKGVALWKAAKNSHKRWFIVLLVLNTLALLEIIYIFVFSRRRELRPLLHLGVKEENQSRKHL